MTEHSPQKNYDALFAGLGLPTRSDRGIADSEKTFDDGSHYAIELSSVNNLSILDRVIAISSEEGIRINRVDECRGISRLPQAEIKDMLGLCAEHDISLVLSSGPRAIYDTGGFVRSTNGSRMGYRLRGMDNLRYALDEIFYACDLGVRNFLIYDEGLLAVIDRLRLVGDLPKDITLKLSVHCGCSNPAAAQVYEKLGADSINVVPDLDLSMLSEIRQSIQCPIDIFTDTAQEAGGFLLTHRVPDIIRYSAPVYLKVGAISQPQQNYLPTEIEIAERMKQLSCVVEVINRKCRTAKQLST